MGFLYINFSTRTFSCVVQWQVGWLLAKFEQDLFCCSTNGLYRIDFYRSGTSATSMYEWHSTLYDILRRIKQFSFFQTHVHCVVLPVRIESVTLRLSHRSPTSSYLSTVRRIANRATQQQPYANNGA